MSDHDLLVVWVAYAALTLGVASLAVEAESWIVLAACAILLVNAALNAWRAWRG